jgi:hypothetical protein
MGIAGINPVGCGGLTEAVEGGVWSGGGVGGGSTVGGGFTTGAATSAGFSFFLPNENNAIYYKKGEALLELVKQARWCTIIFHLQLEKSTR